MTPGDREFGQLEGKVDSLLEGLSELRRANSDEHRQNGRRFEELRRDVQSAIETKADRQVVADQGREIEALKADQAKRFGRDSFAKSAFGAILGGLGVFFAGGGHL